MRWGVFIFVLCGAVAPTDTGLARDVHEDFAALPLDANWFVCRRLENEFRKEPRTGPGGGPALRLIVRPRPPSAAVGLFAHPDCGLESAPNEKFERAEIWEKDCDFEPFGAEVWQSFAIRIDADAPPAAKRLVIGQWKEGLRTEEPQCVSPMLAGRVEASMERNTQIKLGSSPFLAQRFERNLFSITIEQDDATHAPDGSDRQCRVRIAVDANRARDQLEVTAHSGGLDADRTVMVPMTQSDAPGRPLVPDPARTESSCMRDLKVERFAALPNPFGSWVRLKYHLIANAGADGLTEVWADDTLIARARGRIGSVPPMAAVGVLGPVQYFKFGPYRDPELFERSAWIANYAKARREDDLRPTP